MKGLMYDMEYERNRSSLKLVQMYWNSGQLDCHPQSVTPLVYKIILQLTQSKRSVSLFNSLPYDTVLDLYRLKAFTNNEFKNVPQMLIQVPQNLRKNVEVKRKR